VSYLVCCLTARSLSQPNQPCYDHSLVGKKKTFSCAEHQDLGARVKAARALLMDISLKVSRGLGTSSKASRIAHQILEKFDLGLKHELSKAADQDCPDIDSMALYYGPTQDNKVVHHSRIKGTTII